MTPTTTSTRDRTQATESIATSAAEPAHVVVTRASDGSNPTDAHRQGGAAQVLRHQGRLLAALQHRPGGTGDHGRRHRLGATDELPYSQLVLAIGMPMTVILPVIAALSVTSEWTQRTGLATFTLVPQRGRVMLAKAIGSVLVALASTVVAFSVAALGNVAAAQLTGIAPVWDGDAGALAAFASAITLLLLTGFTLGALIRSSAGAVVAYMVYAFVLPGVLTLLAMYQEWFRDLRPWVDAKLTQNALLQGGLAGDQWTHLAVTSLAWFVIPLTIGVRAVLRAEVK